MLWPVTALGGLAGSGGWDCPGHSREDCGGSKPLTQAFKSQNLPEECELPRQRPRLLDELTFDCGLSFADGETEAQKATAAPDYWADPQAGAEWMSFSCPGPVSPGPGTVQAGRAVGSCRGRRRGARAPRPGSLRLHPAGLPGQADAFLHGGREAAH